MNPMVLSGLELGMCERKADQAVRRKFDVFDQYREFGDTEDDPQGGLLVGVGVMKELQQIEHVIKIIPCPK